MEDTFNTLTSTYSVKIIYHTGDVLHDVKPLCVANVHKRPVGSSIRVPRPLII